MQRLNLQRVATIVLTLSILTCGAGIVALVAESGGALPSALCGCIGTSGLLLGEFVDKVGRTRR